MPENKGASPEGISDDATIGFDADGRVLSVSGAAAAALGYTHPEDLEGADLASLIGDEAAAAVLQRMRSTETHELPAEFEDEYESELLKNGTVTFVKQDGTRVPLNAVVTPETSGGWITLLNTAGGGSAGGEPVRRVVELAQIASMLRRLADRTGPSDTQADICAQFANELRDGSGVQAVIVARSTSIAGLYESVAHSTADGLQTSGGAIDLPPSLVPARATRPVTVDSLETLALFEPVIVAGEEITGGFAAARADLTDGVHLLVLATAPAGFLWSDAAALLLESGALTLAGALRAAELGQRLATYSRAQETVRQIGVMASQDHDGGFLEAARRVIARRLPVTALAIHAADPVTSRCYVAAASGGGESSPLAPGFEWQLAGSLEQRVLKTGAPVFISATSPDRISIPSATIAHWRSSGLQTVAALPLREAGEVIAVLLAGFSSSVSDASGVVRLLESITPAVHLGVGLSGGRPGAAPEPDDSAADPGFVSPKVLLALTRAAAESQDTPMLFASVTEWLLEIIPSARVAWGIVDHENLAYRRLYNYGAATAALPDEETVQIEPHEYETLGMAGLQLAEPGHAPDHQRSMRAAVLADQRVLGVVTLWQREDEPFTDGDLARLERICEFISGPLDRIMETESARDSLRQREIITQIGAQAAEFHEPTQALRALRPLVCKLFPHQRMLLVEFDEIAGIAVARYDSESSPKDTGVTVLPISSLPSQDIIRSADPVSMNLGSQISGAAQATHPLFADFRSLLSVPVNAGDGPACSLLLLSHRPATASDCQLRLAASLSDQLTGAQAGWQAYRSTREHARELREIRKQLNLILDSAPVALISTDPNGVCTRLEGHGLETLGIRREEMLGKSIFELTGRLPQLEDAIRQALRGVPATAVTSLGSHSAEVWAQPVTEIDGSVKGVTLVGFDVSERIRSRRIAAENRALQMTLKDRSRIVSTVSHELRTPLTSIIAYTDILSEGTKKQFTPQQSHALSVIQRSAGQLNTLISDLLGLDSGNYELDLSPVDLGNLMREIVDAQMPIFNLAKQTLSLTLPDFECIVEADQLRLTQVVTNLLSNASKYSPENATVAIDVSSDGEKLRISVIDNGPGIPADQLERVWDPGIRIPNSITRSVPGSGLGLSIARKIVELHGGTATIESEIGIGTTVTVVLPGMTATVRSALESETASATQKPAASKASRARTKAKPAAAQQTHHRRRSETG